MSDNNLMAEKAKLEWHCRDKVFTFENSPLLMGILNVTPDSFSDGGRFLDRGKAVDHAMQMIKEGADIIDVGGESTRPGADEVDAAEEASRVIPVVKELSALAGDTVISIDTMKASVARQAIGAGARIINDVSALSRDPAMSSVALESGAGVILMHMRGMPRAMQTDPRYDNVVAEVRNHLAARADDAVRKGIKRARIAVDPGIGFGKTVEHNISLLAGIDKLAALGMPVVVGLSRKSFLGKLTGKNIEERLAASLAGLVYSIIKGVHVLRVHDVRESRDAALVACALRNG
jgi:dihydropteroate synthase